MSKIILTKSNVIFKYEIEKFEYNLLAKDAMQQH